MNNISLENEIIILSTNTIIKLFTYDNWSDVISLYLFYHKQCKIQWTNKSFTQSNFAMKWLWWWDERFKKAKKVLKDLNLIEDIQHRDYKWKILWWYVKLNYIQSDKQANLSTGAENHPLDKTTHWVSEDKCLKYNNINTLSKEDKYNNLLVEFNKIKKALLNNLIKYKNISSCNKKKEERKKKKDEIENRDEVFDKLWVWYCNQNTKKQTEIDSARNWFNKLIKTNYDLWLLRYALPRYIESVNDKTFIVLLRTYLSKKLYLDYKTEFDNLNKKEEHKIEHKEEIQDDIKVRFKRTYETYD